MLVYDVPVLHLVNRFWIGGAERQFVERLRLHPAGFEAVVACLETSGPMFEQVRALGYEPIVFPLKGTMLQANTLRQVARIAALVRERGVKLIHSTDFYSNALGVMVARIASAKSVVSRVDLGHLRAGFGRWHREAEKMISRFADVVVANADAVREICIREEGCKPDRVVVVRNGLDLATFDQLAAKGLREPIDVPEGAPIVAVIGNLWPVKGHRTLLEAVAKLPADLHHVRFVCAGEGPERAYLASRIAELGLRGRVLLLGHRLDVPALLARCNAACLCSSAEGLSNALMEAMAARLPVIATRVGGNPELVREGENGWLVPYGDPGALAEKLTALLRAPEDAQAMGRRGRERVERELTLERMADGYGALYRRLLGCAPILDQDRAVRAA